MNRHEAATIVGIAEKVCGVAEGGIWSKCRSKSYVNARLIATALIMDRFPNTTQSTFAKALGFADHTSASHYMKRTHAVGVREWPSFLAAKREVEKALSESGPTPASVPVTPFEINQEIVDLALRLVAALARAGDARDAEQRLNKTRMFPALSPQPTASPAGAIAGAAE